MVISASIIGINILIHLPTLILPRIPSRGDAFASNLEVSFGQDTARCNDPKIAEIESRSNTTARVFPAASANSREALFGRWLEQHGFVYHVGICKNQPGSLVMFIYNNRITEANIAQSEFFAASPQPPSQQDDSNVPHFQKSPIQDTLQGVETPEKQFSRGEAAAYNRCLRVLNQQGSIKGFPSCERFFRLRGQVTLNNSGSKNRSNKPKQESVKAGLTKSSECRSGELIPTDRFHMRLYAEPWLKDQKIRSILDSALKKGKAKIQSNKLERGKKMAFDEYSIKVYRMPEGISPEGMIKLLAQDMNGTLDPVRTNSAAAASFKALAHFQRRDIGSPKLGELVDINIPGDAGTVQLVELVPDHFIYQTVISDKYGEHPVSGAREFGFRRQANYVEFYTRAADRPYIENLRLPGFAAQTITWESFVIAVSDFINQRGGQTSRMPEKRYRIDINVDCLTTQSPP